MPLSSIERYFTEIGREYFQDADLSVSKITKTLREKVKKYAAHIKQIGRALNDWMYQSNKLKNLIWNKKLETFYNKVLLTCLSWEGHTGEKIFLENNLENLQKSIHVLNKALQSLVASQENRFIHRLK